MYVKSSKAVYRKVDGEVKRFVDCDLYADTVPSPLPTAADIPGYTEDDQLEPGATLYIVGDGTLYMANENGEFVEQ